MSSHRAPNHDALTIRLARPADEAAVRRLAQLDSAAVPGGDVLVAERGDALVAAMPVRGGRAVADPFVATADVVALLTLRAAAMRGERPRRGPALRLRRASAALAG